MPVRPAGSRGALAGESPLALSGAQSQALVEQLRAALALASRRGSAQLFCAAVALEQEVDPCAVAFATRAERERIFCLEQPARGGAALAALGCALSIRAAGQGRFQELAQRWRQISGAAWAVRIEATRGGAQRDPSAALALGGAAFAPGGCSGPLWQDFANAELYVPELALARSADGELRLLLAAWLEPGQGAQAIAEALIASCRRLHYAPLPLLDPAPVGRYHLASAMPPEHYEGAVRRATERIAAGALEKIVLAREVQVHAPRAHQPAALFGALREAFDSCFTYCLTQGHSSLIGASPELLVRRQGQRVSTLALAGSARRSADPAVDGHLGEQLLRSPTHREEHAIVVRRIEQALGERALWVTAAAEPELARIANIQHLATPIRAQLAKPMDALQLAGLLHPTPAIGGEPAAVAAALIPELEGLDRGWYAGPLGWIDGTGDGEYCVALRCALLKGRSAHCFAGNGIVRRSDPSLELAETEVKLQAILPLLAG